MKTMIIISKKQQTITLTVFCAVAYYMTLKTFFSHKVHLFLKSQPRENIKTPVEKYLNCYQRMHSNKTIKPFKIDGKSKLD